MKTLVGVLGAWVAKWVADALELHGALGGVAMMFFGSLPLGMRLRKRMLRQAAYGFRTHRPLIALAAVVAAFAVAAVLAAVVAAAGVIAYGAAHELLPPSSLHRAGRLLRGRDESRPYLIA